MWQRERLKGLSKKKTSLLAFYAFLYTILLPLHDYNGVVKRVKWTLKHDVFATILLCNFSFFHNLDCWNFKWCKTTTTKKFKTSNPSSYESVNPSKFLERLKQGQSFINPSQKSYHTQIATKDARCISVERCSFRLKYIKGKYFVSMEKLPLTFLYPQIQ